MNYKPHYTHNSEYTDNDEIYDEETDYYTEDCDLCCNYENKLYLNDMTQCAECKNWR